MVKQKFLVEVETDGGTSAFLMRTMVFGLKGILKCDVKEQFINLDSVADKTFYNYEKAKKAEYGGVYKELKKRNGTQCS